MVLLEAHRDPLRHFQVLLEARLRAAGLRGTQPLLGQEQVIGKQNQNHHTPGLIKLVVRQARENNEIKIYERNRSHHSSLANNSSTQDANLQHLETMGMHAIYLFRFHIASCKILHAVHEAVLRHLVVGPQELLELPQQRQNFILEQ